MGDEYKLNDKNNRFLTIFTRLLNNEKMKVRDLAIQFGCSEKTISRDFDTIEDFFADFNIENAKGYFIESNSEAANEQREYKLKMDHSKYLTRTQIIAICKILFEARGLIKEEINPIIEKLVENSLLPEDKKFIKDLISNEKFNYVPPVHGKPLLDLILQISEAIKSQRIIKITYRRGEKVSEREIEPLGLIFSEYYFYLAGNIRNIDKSTFQIKYDTNPTVFRLDRIENIETIDQKFEVLEVARFKEGEFRKKIQFMFTGELHHVKMLVKPYNLEIIRDKLPNATFKKEKVGDYEYKVEANLYGEGILFWILGQGDGVKLIGPDILVDKIKQRIEVLNNLYKE